RDPVADHLTEPHALAEKHAETHRGVDMASRNRPQREGHGHEGQSKRKSDSHNTKLRAPQHCCTNSRQDQNKGAKHLSCVFHRCFSPELQHLWMAASSATAKSTACAASAAILHGGLCFRSSFR